MYTFKNIKNLYAYKSAADDEFKKLLADILREIKEKNNPNLYYRSFQDRHLPFYAAWNYRSSCKDKNRNDDDNHSACLEKIVIGLRLDDDFCDDNELCLTLFLTFGVCGEDFCYVNHYPGPDGIDAGEIANEIVMVAITISKLDRSICRMKPAYRHIAMDLFFPFRCD